MALVAALVAVLLAVLWGLGVLPGERGGAPSPGGAPAAARRPTSRPGPSVGPPQRGALPPPRLVRPTRDLFRYASDAAEPATPRATAIAAPTSVPSATPAPAPPPVRLVGFVRRTGRLAAVLQVDGEVVVSEVGQAAGRFTLLALDEDTGVHLRAASGEELQLTPEG